MNLLSLAQSGMHAAESALNVTGNNLNNVLVPEYSRQDIVLAEAGGKSTANGFFGYGVQVETVQRACDNYINHRQRDAESERGFIQGRLQQIEQIDNLFAVKNQSVAAEFDKVFIALQKVSSDPVSEPAREEALAQLRSLCNIFHRQSTALDNLSDESNRKLWQAVDDINMTSQQIASLNTEIEKTYATTRSLPADLLDRRDALLDKLSSQAALRVDENPVTGELHVTLHNGLTLINGSRTNSLGVTLSEGQQATPQVHHLDSAGNRIPLAPQHLAGGKLAGLLRFCQQDLTSASQTLGQQALHIASAFNSTNAAGFTPDGRAGQALFTFDQPIAVGSSENRGNATLSVSYQSISEISAAGYQLICTDKGAGLWKVLTCDGRERPVTKTESGEIRFDGIGVTPDGQPETGDRFQIDPFRGVARSLAVSITHGMEIAASSSADPQDESNNENINAFLSIKSSKLINGATLSDSYATLVGATATETRNLKESEQVSGNICETLAAQKSSITGVNVNEEYINMTLFSQYYQANAQVLKSAIALFDVILNLR